jgi:ornithine cyclodeaminase
LRVLGLTEIRAAVGGADLIGRMRDALVAQAHGECDTPLPMHLGIEAEAAEIHIKSSYRRGGEYFALKMASSFPGNVARGLSSSNGMMLLASAETGEPVAMLADAGYLTDLRTAAVAAMVAKELGRTDEGIGILGAGVQARLQLQMHAKILKLREVWVWGRNRERVLQCRKEMQEMAPAARVEIAGSPAELAKRARLIVTATAAREPLLRADDVAPGTHISAVGSDTVGKQELEAEILRRAALVLVDSQRQCEKLGELQHARDVWTRAVEIGKYCQSPVEWDRSGVSVCDCTGLGVEDLYIAESVWESVLENRTV